MTNWPHETLDDVETFRAELRNLVDAAHENDIQVERAWECTTDDGDSPDWEIEIVQLASNDDVGELDGGRMTR